VLDVRDATVALGQSVHVAFATQAQEAFLEGHVLAFEYFGGYAGVNSAIRAQTA
jgi:hypothetical protein